jgi:hypothetical protein
MHENLGQAIRPPDRESSEAIAPARTLVAHASMPLAL